MRTLLTDAAGARELDRRLITQIGVPGLSLMELAGRGVADVVARVAKRGERVIVLCGPGNNGGDGWVAARWLRALGVAVEVVVAMPPATPDCAAMARCAAQSGVPSAPWSGALPPGEWVVDALLGTGARSPLPREFAALVRAIGARPTVAVDLPTGVSADTGGVSDLAVTAAHTVTFGRFKLGMFAGEGRWRCGVLHRVDLGQEAVDPEGSLARAELGAADCPPVAVPRRPNSAHKRTSGHLLVVAGSVEMAGAAVLACRGALAAGAGLVTAWVPATALPRLGGLPPEVMVVFEPPDPARFSAIAAGPGLGRTPDAASWLQSPTRCPSVFDADALPFAGSGSGDQVITPHSGEAARMLGTTAATVDADRFASACALASGRTVVLKGPATLVASPGHLPWVNPTGGPALATGGSGDVLTGVIGALLARGLSPFDAARLGVWLHGAAADGLAASGSPEPTASQIADALPSTFARFR